MRTIEVYAHTSEEAELNARVHSRDEFPFREVTTKPVDVSRTDDYDMDGRWIWRVTYNESTGPTKAEEAAWRGWDR